MIPSTDQDRDISKEGLIGTTLFHALLLLFFLLMPLFSGWEAPQEGGGLMLNFGTDAEGSGDAQPMADANQQSAMTDLSTPTPENAPAPDEQSSNVLPPDPQKTLTDADPQAPDIGAKDQKDKSKTPKPDNNTKKDTPNKTNNNKADQQSKNTNNTTNNPSPTSAKPSVDPNALFKGNKGNNASSQGNTPGATGDAGDKTGGAEIGGQAGGNNSGGSGGGGSANNGIGFQLVNRKLLSVPPITDNSQESGRIVIKIKVNRDGKVIGAEYTSAGSNTTSSVLKKKALDAALDTKFSTEPNAPEIQTGTMTFTFKVK